MVEAPENAAALIANTTDQGVQIEQTDDSLMSSLFNKPATD
ncbi:MAG: hypothetical protein ACREYE_24800 [Gammaproteobacteria bacterium]